jgi:lipopolysaccharide/colanic/teichoic acid biosynthesis glycosyltransferase
VRTSAVRFGWGALNRTVAALALLLLSPVIIVVAAWIRIADGPGILFVQDRAGRDGVPFRMWKFRSMVHNAVGLSAQLGISDPFGLVEDDPRITRCGRFLRRTSLDELPQLVNVVRGQMNLVGPRPDVLPQVANYSANDRRRLEVKPGITGWAQVNGWRGETDDIVKMEKRVQHDLEYIQNWHLLWDLKIILLTLVGTKKSHNAY